MHTGPFAPRAEGAVERIHVELAWTPHAEPNVSRERERKEKKRKEKHIISYINTFANRNFFLKKYNIHFSFHLLKLIKLIFLKEKNIRFEYNTLPDKAVFEAPYENLTEKSKENAESAGMLDKPDTFSEKKKVRGGHHTLQA
jgi:hypothetical protein